MNSAARNLDDVVDESQVLGYEPPQETLVHRLARYYHTCAGKVSFYVGKLRPRVDPKPEEIVAIPFLWRPRADEPIDARAVVCIELPVRNPVELLGAYMSAGVRPDHVVFVGDTMTMRHDEYSAVRKKGALVHHDPKKDRQQAQRGLSSYFRARHAAVEPQYTVNNPYTYAPAPPKVSPEELRAFVQAVAAQDRRR